MLSQRLLDFRIQEIQLIQISRRKRGKIIAQSAITVACDVVNGLFNRWRHARASLFYHFFGFPIKNRKTRIKTTCRKSSISLSNSSNDWQKWMVQTYKTVKFLARAALIEIRDIGLAAAGAVIPTPIPPFSAVAGLGHLQQNFWKSRLSLDSRKTL